MQKLLNALGSIAAIPLWGEYIKDDKLREEYQEAGEWDKADNTFAPFSDTECNYLRDAVETARAALELPEDVLLFSELLTAVKAWVVMYEDKEPVPPEARLAAWEYSIKVIAKAEGK